MLNFNYYYIINSQIVPWCTNIYFISIFSWADVAITLSKYVWVVFECNIPLLSPNANQPLSSRTFYSCRVVFRRHSTTINVCLPILLSLSTNPVPYQYHTTDSFFINIAPSTNWYQTQARPLWRLSLSLPVYLPYKIYCIKIRETTNSSSWLDFPSI